MDCGGNESNFQSEKESVDGISTSGLSGSSSCNRQTNRVDGCISSFNHNTTSNREGLNDPRQIPNDSASDLRAGGSSGGSGRDFNNEVKDDRQAIYTRAGRASSVDGDCQQDDRRSEINETTQLPQITERQDAEFGKVDNPDDGDDSALLLGEVEDEELADEWGEIQAAFQEWKEKQDQADSISRTSEEEMPTPPDLTDTNVDEIRCPIENKEVILPDTDVYGADTDVEKRRGRKKLDDKRPPSEVWIDSVISGHGRTYRARWDEWDEKDERRKTKCAVIRWVRDIDIKKLESKGEAAIKAIKESYEKERI